MNESSLQSFELVIRGDNVFPDTVDVDALAPLLKAFRTAIAGMESLFEKPDRDFFVSFSGTDKGSNRLLLKCNSGGMLAMEKLTAFIERNHQSRLPKKVIRSLDKMNECVARFGWEECELRGGRFKNTIVARNPSSRKTYCGLTTLYGRFFKVGGLGPQTASLQLDDGKRVSVRLRDKEMAIDLGKRLHQTIGLEGEAVWFTDTDELKSFEAHKISSFSDRNADESVRTFSDALEALRKVSGDRWDKVDPERYLKDLRSDEEESV